MFFLTNYTDKHSFLLSESVKSVRFSELNNIADKICLNL